MVNGPKKTRITSSSSNILLSLCVTCHLPTTLRYTLYIRSGNASPLVPLKVTPNVYTSRGGGAGQEEGNPRTKLHDSGTAVLSSSLVMFTVISWPAKQSGMRSWVGTNHWPKSDPPESETTTQRHRQYTAKLSSLGVIFACHGCCCYYYLLPPPEQGTGNSL